MTNFMRIIASGIGLTLAALTSFAVQAGGADLKLGDSKDDIITPRWDKRLFPITWVLNREGYPNTDNPIAIADLEVEIKAAFATWEAVPSSFVRFRYGGLADAFARGIDGQQLITFTDPDVDFPPGVVGMAFTYTFNNETIITDENNDLDGDGQADLPNGTYPAGTIFDADIVLKSNIDYSISGARGSVDLRAIVTHEIGHFLGLSHASIDDAVMFPFQNPDVTVARTLNEDDIGFLSYFYPDDSSFALTFGLVEGQVLNGNTDEPIVGAHVYAINPDTGKKLAGAYTGWDGRYELPLRQGTYFIGIEPLDGEPPALDPKRINVLIASTSDTQFSEELYDANESSVESDPLAAIPITINAGGTTNDINFRTNILSFPGVTVSLEPGVNYFSYPGELPAGLSAFDLLRVLGEASEINTIERINPETQRYERASYQDDRIIGQNFPIRSGEGYRVFATQTKTLTLRGRPHCAKLTLDVGLNLVGIHCPPAGYSAFDLLTSLGGKNAVKSIRRFDRSRNFSGEVADEQFEQAYYDNGQAAGVDFPLVNGEAYFIEMLLPKTQVDVSGGSSAFPPLIRGISPGKAGVGALVSVMGQGFEENINVNRVSFNGSDALVVSASASMLNVLVPEGARSGPLNVTVNGKTSNSINFEVLADTVDEAERDPNELLVSGEKVKGRLNSSDEQDRYRFIALKGDVVSISAESPSLDLALMLEGIGGVILTMDDNSGSGNNPLINNFTIPASGEYTVVVVAAPGSNPGDYTLEINWQRFQQKAQIAVLGGSAQTAVAGTALSEPLSFYITGDSGQALAGVPVSITAKNINLPNKPQANADQLTRAGSTVITTNNNGIAIVDLVAPNEPGGVYQLEVSVPGMEPVRVAISTIATPIESVVIENQVVDCDGKRCPVNQKISLPYSIQYFDKDDQPIPNVFTNWAVVAGNGSLLEFNPALVDDGSANQLSDAEGKSQVFHKLGTKLYTDLDGGRDRMLNPQAVVAYPAGLNQPVLYTAKARSGPPASFDSINSTALRVTYSTLSTNAMRVRVRDAFDNPVEDALIEAQSAGIQVAPGVYKSQFFNDFRTNADGIWVGLLNTANTIPTINEFDKTDTPGLASTYVVLLKTGSFTVKYEVEVDMGPTLVFGGKSGEVESAYVGQALENLSGAVLRYQRKDSNNNNAWTDESFVSNNIRSLPVDDVPITLSIERQDSYNPADYPDILGPSLNGKSKVETKTDKGFFRFDASMGDVGGPLVAIAEVSSPITLQLTDEKGAAVGEPVVFSRLVGQRNGYSLKAKPIIVRVQIDASELSGIDWTTLDIQLNDQSIFKNKAGKQLKLNTYPYFAQFYLGGSRLAEWPSEELLSAGGFEQLIFVYQPLGSSLIEGTNGLSLAAELATADTEKPALWSKYQSFQFNKDVVENNWNVEVALDNQPQVIEDKANFSRAYFTESDAVIDNFQEFTFKIEEESFVRVDLLDADEKPIRALVKNEKREAGEYKYIVLREDLNGIDSRLGTDFNIRLVTIPVNPSPQSAPLTVLYRGELESSVTSESLGQVIQHNTLLHRGDLTLRREDFALPGVGPTLSFSRSYSNTVRAENNHTAMGDGWTHNHNIFVKVLAVTDTNINYRNNLPSWIAETRTGLLSSPVKLFPKAELNEIKAAVLTAPSIVTVSNAGTFILNKATGEWQAQRGYHGKLTQETNFEGRNIWFFTSKDGTEYRFDPNTDAKQRYLIQSVTDRNGNTLSYQYQQDGGFAGIRRVSRVTDTVGRYLKFDYGINIKSGDRLTQVTAFDKDDSELGIQLKLEYYQRAKADSGDASPPFALLGLLKSASRDDFKESYLYEKSANDDLANLTRITDPLGRNTYYEYFKKQEATFFIDLFNFAPGLNIYDIVKRVCYPTPESIEPCNADVATFTYKVDVFNSRDVTDLRGNVTQYTFNGRGNPIRVVAPEGQVTDFVWSPDRSQPDNLLLEKHDRSIGASWFYEYDSQGNVIKSRDPMGSERIQEWNQDFAVLTYRKDENGNEMRRVLDDNGNILSEQQDAFVGDDFKRTSIEWRHSYDSFSDEINESVGRGLRSSTTQTVSGTDQIQLFAYDAYGNLKAIRLGEGSRNEFENDARGRRLVDRDSLGRETRFEYDNLDRITKVTDPKGNMLRNEYDAKGNLTLEVQSDSYRLGMDGAAPTITRELSLTYTYDVRDRVTKTERAGQVSQDGTALENGKLDGERLYTYDGESNVLSETDWQGQLTQYRYDGLNRQTLITNREGNSASTSYEFVKDEGLRQTARDYLGRATTSQFDRLGRLIKVQLPEVTQVDGSTRKYRRNLQYDKLGNLVYSQDEEGRVTQFAYDPRNLKVSETDAKGNTALFSYDEAGNLIKTIDQAGRTTITGYDRQNRAVKKWLPEGQIWQYVYDLNDNVISSIDPWGFTTGFSYDELNQRTRVTYHDGTASQEVNTKDGQLAFVQDAQGYAQSSIHGLDERVLQSKDQRGRQTTNTFDGNGNLITASLSWPNAPVSAQAPANVLARQSIDAMDRVSRRIEADGSDVARQLSFEYDKQGNLVAQIAPEGRETRFVYDELNRVIKTIRADASHEGVAATPAHPPREIWQQYDGTGLEVLRIDPRGNRTETEYDQLGRAIKVTDALGQSSYNVYDNVGNVTKQINKRRYGRETRYDGLNRPVESFAIKQVANPQFDSNGDIFTEQAFRLSAINYDLNIADGGRRDASTDANGNTITETYNFRGQVIETKLPAANDDSYTEASITREYDDSGWLVSETDAAGNVTLFSYFADGAVQYQTNAENETTNFKYDIFGNQIQVVKPKGNAQTSLYDARNRLTQVTDAAGSVTRFAYDVNNNLRHQYFPAANDAGTPSHVEYEYDTLDRQVAHIQHKASGNLVKRFAYDAADNVTRLTDPKGQVFVKTYDALNREVKTDYPAGSDLNSIETVYDENNNIVTITENTPTGPAITLQNYDLLDRLVSQTQRGHFISYQYDNNGNRIKVSSSGGTSDYTFDTRNRLSTVVAKALTTRYQYLQNGWLSVVAQGNGTAVNYTFDKVGRTTQIKNTDRSGAVLSQFDYQYDKNSNRTQQTEIQNGFSTAAKTVVTTYRYDEVDRMSAFTHSENGSPVAEHQYSFYPSFDRKSEKITESGTVIKDRIFTYDETHWVKQIEEKAPGKAGTITYTYDANGNNTQKTNTTGAGPASTKLTFNTRDQLIQVSAGASGSEASQGQYAYDYQGMRIRHLGSSRGDIEYIYDGKSVLDERLIQSDGESTVLAHYRYGDRLLSLATAADEQFYHYASLGTTANLSNLQGENVQAYRVDPFGEITEQEGNSINRRVFTGHEHDEETGLIYMKARFYDPDIGRFLNQDTYLGEPGRPPSLHRYLYAYHNPGIYVDESGNFAIWGAVFSAGIDLAFQGYQIATGEKKLREFSVTDILIAGVAGAAGVGIAARLNNLKNVGKMGAKSAAVQNKAVITAGLAVDIGLSFSTKSLQKAGKKLEDYVWRDENKKFADLSFTTEDFSVPFNEVLTDVVAGRLGGLAGKFGSKFFEKTQGTADLIESALEKSKILAKQIGKRKSRMKGRKKPSSRKRLKRLEKQRRSFLNEARALSGEMAEDIGRNAILISGVVSKLTDESRKKVVEYLTKDEGSGTNSQQAKPKVTKETGPRVVGTLNSLRGIPVDEDEKNAK